jgi:hypothetical protein
MMHYRGSSGDMPVMAASNNIQRSTNYLRIFLTDANSRDVFTVNDKVVLTGFTDSNLTSSTNNVNNKPLLIRAKGASTNFWIELEYNPGSLSTTATTDSGGSIKQIHKKYKRTALPSGIGLPASSSSEYTGIGAELEAYNVLGTIGSDDRVVPNYLEIKTTTVTPSPAKHTKKVRFFFEEENSARPFELQLNFNITQYKPVQIQTGGGGGNGFIQAQGGA